MKSKRLKRDSQKYELINISVVIFDTHMLYRLTIKINNEYIHRVYCEVL